MKVFRNTGDVGFKITIKEMIDNWLYGNFLLLLRGNFIGNVNDDYVDLKGCINWLSDFVVNPQDRYAPELMLPPKEVVWQLIVTPVFEAVETIEYPDSSSRFHISRLGMSSFDQVTLVMFNDGRMHERILWQQGKDEIREFIAPIGSLEVAAKEAITWFHEVTSIQPHSGSRGSLNSV